MNGDDETSAGSAEMIVFLVCVLLKIEDVLNLSRMLILFNCDSRATQLQSQLDQFMKKIEECYVEIWSPSATAQCNVS